MFLRKLNFPLAVTPCETLARDSLKQITVHFHTTEEVHSPPAARACGTLAHGLL